jgi:hypothetical protein
MAPSPDQRLVSVNQARLDRTPVRHQCPRPALGAAALIEEEQSVQGPAGSGGPENRPARSALLLVAQTGNLDAGLGWVNAAAAYCSLLRRSLLARPEALAATHRLVGRYGTPADSVGDLSIGTGRHM